MGYGRLLGEPASDAWMVPFLLSEHTKAVIRELGFEPCEFPDDSDIPTYGMKDLPGIIYLKPSNSAKWNSNPYSSDKV